MAALRTGVLVAAAWLQVSLATACATPTDCSLNGDCVDGLCVCDPWWAGSAACDVLAITPANKSDGYHNATFATWGGMSIRDESGLWHVFAAEMLNHCGLGSWKTNSIIMRGESSGGPGGPFTFAQAVSVPFSHNPKIFRDPVDGTYLLFSIGSGLWTTTPSNCSPPDGAAASVSPSGDADSRPPWVGQASHTSSYPGPCGDGCGAPPLNSGCGMSLGTAPSLEGPWTFTSINVTNQSVSALLDCAHTNPSPWIFPNGSIVMAINAGYCHDGLETIGLLSAPSYRGPWTFLNDGDPILLEPDGSPHHCEDPFLWWTSRGFHLMVHNQEGAGVARYAHSVDGRNWTLHAAPGPYTDSITWDDGTVDNFDVERPQFVFDPDSGRPLYLTNGAQGSPLSFTLFRPLAQTPPPPPPPPVRFVNSRGECLVPSAPFPCWNASAGFSICPLVAGSCAGDDSRWLVDASTGTVTSALYSPAPIDVDCDSCEEGSVAKLISSGAVALIFDAQAGQLKLPACATSTPKCLTTGIASGATPPCGGGGEPWTPTQVHVLRCSNASATVGWAAQAA